MKKLEIKKLMSPSAIGLILIAAGAAILVLLIVTKSNNDENTVTTTPPPPAYKIVNACQAFTLADAKKFLGSNAKKSSGTAVNVPSKDTSVSTCVYGQDSGSVPINKVKNLKTATILTRSPKTSAGKISNQAEFGKSKPAGVQNVSGVGDKAFWAPTYGQLHILKGYTWVILSTGTSVPSSHTLVDTKKMADIVVPKL